MSVPVAPCINSFIVTTLPVLLSILLAVLPSLVIVTVVIRLDVLFYADLLLKKLSQGGSRRDSKVELVIEFLWKDSEVELIAEFELIIVFGCIPAMT